MSWHELMTQTGLPIMLCMTLVVGALALLIHVRTAPARHVRTDPACVEYHEPTTALGWRLYARARGRACRVCYPAPFVSTAHEPLSLREWLAALDQESKQ